MPKTLSASRIVAGEPAVAALLIADPAAASFIPQTTLVSDDRGSITAVLQLAETDERTLRVLTNPPRRTPTAYIAEFKVEIDGMPDAVGALHVTSAGPARSQVVFSLTSEEELPPGLDSVFRVVVNGFFDQLERAAEEQTRAA